MKRSAPFTSFGNDPKSWDLEDTGLPGITMVAGALEVWVGMRSRIGGVPVDEAALTFNMTPDMVRSAVLQEGAWMYLRNVDTIELDGE